MLPETILKELLDLVKGGKTKEEVHSLQERVKDELLKNKDAGTERVFYALTKWTDSEMNRANLQFLLTRYLKIQNESGYDWIEMESNDLESFTEVTDKCFQLDFDETEKQRFNEFLDWIKDVPGTVAEAFNRSKELKIWIRGSGSDWELFIIGKRELVDKLRK